MAEFEAGTKDSLLRSKGLLLILPRCFLRGLSFALEPRELAINFRLQLTAVNGVVAQLFLNSEKLVVLTDPVRARE